MIRICLLLVFALPVMADDVIIVGQGGEPELETKFQNWGKRLRDVLIELGRDAEQIHLLTTERTGRQPTLTEIRELFADLAQRHDREADLFVYLIGHGTYLRDIAKLQVPGDDLAASELDGLLAAVPAGKTILINSASASAGFINVLSKQGRIIGAATKSVYEENATEFTEYFIQGLEKGGADRNRDQRISIWEAMLYGAMQTEAFFDANGLIATEHAIIDDNGDGLGTRLYVDPERETEVRPQDNPDGDLARATFLKDFTFPEKAPEALVASYLSLMDRVTELKGKKKGMAETRYYAELETLFLKAARVHREIRGYGEE